MNQDVLMTPSLSSVHFVTDLNVEGFMFPVGFNVITGDLSQVRTDGELFTLISEKMKLPEYFGRNWDALQECIGDPDCLEGGGHILVLYGAKQAWEEVPALMRKMVDCWSHANDYWYEEGIPFHLVFVM